jgi:hypothetical protein
VVKLLAWGYFLSLAAGFSWLGMTELFSTLLLLLVLELFWVLGGLKLEELKLANPFFIESERRLNIKS